MTDFSLLLVAESCRGHGPVHPELVAEPGAPEPRAEARGCRRSARCAGVGIHG